MRRVRLALAGILILTGAYCSSARAALPAPKHAAATASDAAQSPVAGTAADTGNGAQSGAVTVGGKPVIGPAEERTVVWLCIAGVVLSLLWTAIAWWRARVTQRAREADTDPDSMMIGSRNGTPAHQSPRLRQ